MKVVQGEDDILTDVDLDVEGDSAKRSKSLQEVRETLVHQLHEEDRLVRLGVTMNTKELDNVGVLDGG